MPLTQLRLSQLTLDPRCQARVAFSEAHAEDLADLRRRGIAYRDPLVVFQDGRTYYLADGFHRLRGEELAGGKTVLCDVRKGTLRDAQLYAAGTNKELKLGRSHEDKRRAVLLLITDEEWSQWPNTRIAAHCGVTEGLVRDVKVDLKEERERRAAAQAARDEAENSSSGEPEDEEEQEDTADSYYTSPSQAEEMESVARKRKNRASYKDRAQALEEIRKLAERIVKLAGGIKEQPTVRRAKALVAGLPVV